MSQRQAIPLQQMVHSTPNQREAIRELEQLFCLDQNVLKDIVNSFRNELAAGLADDRTSDLNMIPTYVTGYPTGNEKGTYLALEIAGMDIYACQVRLKGDNGKLAINQFQYKIPQDLASGDDFAVLIDYIVECISDFLTRVGTQDLFIYPMAVSFGFAIKQTRLNTGRILSLGYGLSYPNGVGVDIVELMHERMRRKGLPIKIVAIANDSVCTLLAHAYQHPTTRIGIVHSLGTNCAYYEPVKNVTKLRDQSITKDTDMIMNTEWCNFGSSKRTLPCTWFDRKLSRESINPQFHVFEKMTTGIFLGELVRNIIIYLVDRDVLFGGESSEVLNTVHSFDTSYMYVCEADDSDSLEDTRIILEDMLDLSKTTMGDREVVKKVCELVGMRAAQLVGASIAAIVQHMVERGIGMTDQGYAISISGSIYEDYPSFHPRVCRTIKELIPEEIACKLSVGVVKHSRIVGAAIVAMMAEKIAADKRSRS
ncbi:glucokinase [Rhizopus azygosporus]|uniref:Phosphotransferase n=1 Tax=Rhizopus azygosporus TaxID=86630 RepID=A0A367J812_RHIAZ|nr:glucokinase [Rhizopus azygosporus]